MAGHVLHVGAVVECSHVPGLATPNMSIARVTVSGQAVVVVAMPYAVAGCPLSSPCVSGQWTSGAQQVRVMGQPLAIDTGASACVPTSTPMVPRRVQHRVTAN
ncbi:MAG: uncharacterized protein JWQ90_3004 [Hydrocarboniphaga sp.]|uniref:hypothetical protein n=1 Tax=Hydrocarboniphaga sp. TaxID=2033016 RepID=UPI00261398CC|nr:hypothetical protein [Hydrocarboniphaga sp.]MDB5970554.1 uncharacterized protein [Hydrocarboniphaga sp.]